MAEYADMLRHAEHVGAQGAWKLAAIEVERLACAQCKKNVQDAEWRSAKVMHAGCLRALRLARSFRGRAEKAK